MHYHYVSVEEMKAEIGRGSFIENAVFSGNMYGTSRQAVEAVLKQGKICILDIEMQGVKQLKEGKNAQLNPHYVFIRPPSMEVLEARLRERGTENEDSLKKRLDTAKEEMKYGEEKGNFHIVVVNDDLDKAYQSLREYILPEIQKLSN